MSRQVGLSGVADRGPSYRRRLLAVIIRSLYRPHVCPIVSVSNVFDVFVSSPNPLFFTLSRREEKFSLAAKFSRARLEPKASLPRVKDR
jgi:hypothetical protein